MIEKQEHYLISVKRHGIQAVKPYEAMQTMADPADPAIISLAFLIWRKAAIYYPAIVRLLYPADLYLIA